MDVTKLRPHVPAVVYAYLNNFVIRDYQIDSDLKMAHFLSQCEYESQNYARVEENLNYSAQGLLNIFPRYFNATTARQYERQPERIANRVYANRLGNGDEASGDGWRYRGRGYIQLTGKSNYDAYKSNIGEDVVSNPDLVAQRYPLDSAGWFFKTNRLFTKAEDGMDYPTSEFITKKVSGQTTTAMDRYTRFLKYYSILTDIVAPFHLVDSRGKKLHTMSFKFAAKKKVRTKRPVR